MSQSKKSLLVIIDHPMNIITAIGLALLLEDDYNLSLLISRHPYWEPDMAGFIKDYFAKIYWFDQVGFSKNVAREFKKIRRIKRELRDLAIPPADGLLILSNKSFLESLIFSVYPHNKRVSLNPDYIYNGAASDQTPHQYQETLTSKIWNLTLLPFFKLTPLMYLENVVDRGLYDIAYKTTKAQLFNRCFSIKTNYQAELQENEIYDLSYYVQNRLVRSTLAGTKKIVFFGEAIDAYQAEHLQFTNNCLRYIEKYFPGHEYIYKPHPNDHLEAQSLELGQFTVYPLRTIAEFFILHNLDNIAYCFAIHSTSLRQSIALGITSYYFLKMYRYASLDFRNVMLQLAGQVDSHAFLESFTEAPQLYRVEFSVPRIKAAASKLREYLLSLS